MNPGACQIAFCVQCAHATTAGGGHGLAPAAVLDVTGGEDAGDLGLRRAGAGDQVAGLVGLELAVQERGVGDVADGVEEALGGDDPLLAGLDVTDAHAAQHALALGADDGVVPDHLDLGVVHQALLHDLRRAQLAAAVDHVDLRAELGQVRGLLHGGVAAADDDQGLRAEERQRAVTHRAGRDAAVPQALLAGDVEPLGGGAGGQDQRPRVDRLALGRHAEGAPGQVHRIDGLGDDARAVALGLGAHALHQLGTVDALGEAGEVLDLGGGRELAARGDAAGQEALEHQRAQVGAGGVDGRGVPGRAGADDDDLFDGLCGLC